MPELEVRHRGVGKLAYGHTGPTCTPTLVEVDDVLTVGERYIDSGVWVEFYVKTLYTKPGQPFPRRERVARTGSRDHALPPPDPVRRPPPRGPR